MPSNPQRTLPFQPARYPYRTLQGWALGTLIEQGAVAECEHHGHRRDRADPDAWNRAREEAWRNPFPAALAELLAKKQKGQPIAASRKAAPSNVVNLMDALRASLKESGEAKTPAKKATKKRKAG